jgi:hypothetical protein
MLFNKKIGENLDRIRGFGGKRNVTSRLECRELIEACMPHAVCTTVPGMPCFETAQDSLPRTGDRRRICILVFCNTYSLLDHSLDPSRSETVQPERRRLGSPEVAVLGERVICIPGDTDDTPYLDKATLPHTVCDIAQNAIDHVQFDSYGYQ